MAFLFAGIFFFIIGGTIIGTVLGLVAGILVGLIPFLCDLAAGIFRGFVRLLRKTEEPPQPDNPAPVRFAARRRAPVRRVMRARHDWS